jgi:NADPH:quinone reductase-like Zn-dependent oxidoreductase
VVRGILGSRFSDQKAIGFITKHNQDDLNLISELIEARKVRPVVDRTYPLSEAAEAMAYVEQNRAKGKVVVTI